MSLRANERVNGLRGFEWTRKARQEALGSTGSAERTDPTISSPTLRRPRGGRLRLVLIASDASATALAWLAVLVIGGTFVANPWQSVALIALVCVVAVVLASHWCLYLARVNTVRSAELAALLRISVVVSIVGWFTARGRFGADPWWTSAIIAGVLTFLFLAASRSVFDSWIKSRRRAGAYCRRILLVGRDDAAVELLELVADQPELGYRIVGFVGPRVETGHVDFPVEWVAPYEDLEQAIAERGANGVLVASSALGVLSLRAALCDLVESGVHVQVSTGLQGLDHRRLRASTVGYEPVLYLEPVHTSRYERHAKRVMDVLGAALGLLLSSPILLVAAVAIKMHDRGPVFFRQERIGKDARPFQVLKLRTMEIDAENKLAALLDDNRRDGPLFKLGVDPRVTPPGRILRATSLDELPQLFNVLKGEMSLVGPRPALASEVDQFDDELRQRQQMTPGITGLWQLEARDNPSFRAYRRLDLFYLRNWSISLDLMILLLTAYTVVIRAITPERLSEDEPVEDRSAKESFVEQHAVDMA